LSRFARRGRRRKNREIERTNYWKEKNPTMAKDLGKPSRKPGRGPAKRSPKKSGWSPERRAKQAELIRASRPWLKSTGPRTDAGKARSAANATKHGFRSSAFVQRVRDERRLIREAAAAIRTAKMLLRFAALAVDGPRITGWAGSGEVPSTIPCEAEGGGGRTCLSNRPSP
jgi:hypothetical protein